jgi:hypothetical protein
LVAILTSWRKRIEGHSCRCRKPRSDAGGMLSFKASDFDAEKKDVIDFCKKGVMPLTFHEKIRMLLGPSGGRGFGAFGAWLITGVDVGALVLRRFGGGGLMSRLIFTKLRTNTLEVFART